MSGLEAALDRILSPRFIAQVRPILVAVAAIALCLLLFRPRRKPQQPHRGATTSGAGTSAAGASGGRGPAVSVSTCGVLLEFEAGTPRLLPGAVDALLRISSVADVYLVTTLPEDSDALETATLEALGSGGLFAKGGCERCKALFCATEDGRSAMVRQLSPAAHVDTSPKVLQYLAPHLQRVVYVNRAGSPLEGAAGSVVQARSLEEYADVHAGRTDA